jgi:hypothetical protein
MELLPTSWRIGVEHTYLCNGYSTVQISDDENRTQFQSSILVIFQKLVNKEKVTTGLYYSSSTTKSDDSVTQKCWFNIDTQKDACV